MRVSSSFSIILLGRVGIAVAEDLADLMSSPAAKLQRKALRSQAEIGKLIWRTSGEPTSRWRKIGCNIFRRINRNVSP
jgi:hypothetical protein